MVFVLKTPCSGTVSYRLLLAGGCQWPANKDSSNFGVHPIPHMQRGVTGCRQHSPLPAGVPGVAGDQGCGIYAISVREEVASVSEARFHTVP